VILEDLIKELRKDFSSIATQMTDLRKRNDENKEEINRSESEWKEKLEEERFKRV
jgi:hypothetical protein